MAQNPRRTNSSKRNNLRAWLRSQHRGCWICRVFGRPDYIDYSLPAGHPLSFEVDELVPVSKGGSPYSRTNVDAAHRRCNQWRGNKSVQEVIRLAQVAAGVTPSRQTAAPSVKGVTSGLME